MGRLEGLRSAARGSGTGKGLGWGGGGWRRPPAGLGGLGGRGRAGLTVLRRGAAAALAALQASHVLQLNLRAQKNVGPRAACTPLPPFPLPPWRGGCGGWGSSLPTGGSGRGRPGPAEVIKGLPSAYHSRRLRRPRRAKHCQAFRPAVTLPPAGGGRSPWRSLRPNSAVQWCCPQLPSAALRRHHDSRPAACGVSVNASRYL